MPDPAASPTSLSSRTLEWYGLFRTGGKAVTTSGRMMMERAFGGGGRDV